MRSTASPPQFKILNSKFKIQNSNCKASPCLSFRASRGIFTMRNFVSPPSFFFFLSSFFFLLCKASPCLCKRGRSFFTIYFVKTSKRTLHEFFSHTTLERTREGTETLPYTIRAKRNKNECVARSPVVGCRVRKF